MRIRTARRPCPVACRARCSCIHRSRASRWTRRALASSTDLHWRRRPAAQSPPAAAAAADARAARGRETACTGTDTRRSSSMPSSGAARSPSPSRTCRSRRRADSGSSVAQRSGRHSLVPSCASSATLAENRSPSAPDTASVQQEQRRIQACSPCSTQQGPTTGSPHRPENVGQRDFFLACGGLCMPYCEI